MEGDNLANYDLDSDEDEVQINRMIQRAEADDGSQNSRWGTPKSHEKMRRFDDDDAAVELGSVVANKDDNQHSESILRTFSRPRIGGPQAGFYSVISPESVRQRMSQIVTEVSRIITVPTETARLLLVHFCWDRDRLIDRFSVDLDQIYKDARVANPAAYVEMVPCPDCCDICYLPMDATNSEQSSCGHTFCTGCWFNYLVNRVSQENAFTKISCPAHNCQILLDEMFIMRILAQNSEVHEKYQQGLLSDFILAEKNSMRFCQGPDCDRVISLTKPGEWVCVKCTKCANTFCFTCGEPWHDPVPCQLLKRWTKKRRDDSETGNWIAVNTKDCPSCDIVFEKIGGCNQMFCSACGVEFCWICLRVGDASERHVCNTYQRNGHIVESRRAVLERYLFYDKRFTVLEQSLSFETELVEAAVSRMDEMVKCGMTWMEAQFVKDAAATLVRCRQTLMNTYPFAYFLKKNWARDIFEFNQAGLEAATEKLSGALEYQVSTRDNKELTQWRRNVLDSMAYVECRRVKLRNHVYEGYEDGTWIFTV